MTVQTTNSAVTHQLQGVDTCCSHHSGPNLERNTKSHNALSWYCSSVFGRSWDQSPANKRLNVLLRGHEAAFNVCPSHFYPLELNLYTPDSSSPPFRLWRPPFYLTKFPGNPPPLHPTPAGFMNLLTPNVNYSGRTAPLTSKVAFYIFIQQV